MKPVHTVVQHDPLILHINKAGRPVAMSVAEAYVKKQWPEKTWHFKKTDHSIVAEEHAAVVEEAARRLLAALNWQDATRIGTDPGKILFAQEKVSECRDQLRDLLAEQPIAYTPSGAGVYASDNLQ